LASGLFKRKLTRTEMICFFPRPKAVGDIMTRYSPLAASTAFLAFAAVAHAHPGHGEPGDDFSLTHYATEPMHLGVGFCLFFGAVVLIGLLRASYLKRRRQEPVC
jgi:hypothetical protein